MNQADFDDPAASLSSFYQHPQPPFVREPVSCTLVSGHRRLRLLMPCFSSIIISTLGRFPIHSFRRTSCPTTFVKSSKSVQRRLIQYHFHPIASLTSSRAIIPSFHSNKHRPTGGNSSAGSRQYTARRMPMMGYATLCGESRVCSLWRRGESKATNLCRFQTHAPGCVWCD